MGPARAAPGVQAVEAAPMWARQRPVGPSRATSETARVAPPVAAAAHRRSEAVAGGRSGETQSMVVASGPRGT